MGSPTINSNQRNNIKYVISKQEMNVLWPQRGDKCLGPLYLGQKKMNGPCKTI